MSHLTPILVLITHAPTHPLAHKALQFCQAYAKQLFADQATPAQHQTHPLSDKLNVFFYGDAASTANRLRWQPADQAHLTQDWQVFAHQYGMTLPVCVSTALARGVSDTDNATRHQLIGDNLATGFKLVGLSELAMLMNTHKLMTF